MGSDTYSGIPLNLLAIVLVFGCVLLFPWTELWRKPRVVKAAVKGARPLKPKTEADCPFCQAEQGAIIDEVVVTVLPRPWQEGRRRRGRQKESVTAGYACDNARCVYYAITDASIHALVADGHHTCAGAQRQRGASVGNTNRSRT